MRTLLAAASEPEPIDLGPALKGLIDGLLIGLRAFWPLFVLLALIAVGRLALHVYRLRRLARSGIHEVDAMDGRTFEVFLGTLFRRLGYHVEHTGRRGDYGADLVVAKNGRRTAVQAKCWSKSVGVGAVQEAVAAKGYYQCDAALVVSNRPFTAPARKLAQANGVTLWGRDELVAKLLATSGAHSAEPATAPAPDSSAPPTPTPLTDSAPAATRPNGSAALTNGQEERALCVTCGAAVSDKVRDYCITHASRFGGRIYCFKHQRRGRAALAPSD